MATDQVDDVVHNGRGKRCKPTSGLAGLDLAEEARDLAGLDLAEGGCKGRGGSNNKLLQAAMKQEYVHVESSKHVSTGFQGT